VGLFSLTRDGGELIECILVLNLPWSIEDTFYFEMFVLNSKFHELRQFGAVFMHRGAGQEAMSCISILNSFSE